MTMTPHIVTSCHTIKYFISAFSLLKRLLSSTQQYARIDDVTHINSMDQLHADHVMEISSAVDDLVAGLYAPLQQNLVRENVSLCNV